MLSMYKRTFFGNLVKKKIKIKRYFWKRISCFRFFSCFNYCIRYLSKNILDPLNTSVTQLTKVMEIKAVNEDTKEKLRALNSIGRLNNARAYKY